MKEHLDVLQDGKFLHGLHDFGQLKSLTRLIRVKTIAVMAIHARKIEMMTAIAVLSNRKATTATS